MDKDRFKKVYNKIPLKEKDMPILVLDNKEITWKRALKEIKNGTDIGEKIYKELVEQEII